MSLEGIDDLWFWPRLFVPILFAVIGFVFKGFVFIGLGVLADDGKTVITTTAFNGEFNF